MFVFIWISYLTAHSYLRESYKSPAVLLLPSKNTCSLKYICIHLQHIVCSIQIIYCCRDADDHCKYVVASYLSSCCRMFGQPFLLICQENVHLRWNPWTNFPFASFTLSASKSREGIESGYSSLEKTRSDAEDTQTGPDQDYRCERLTHPLLYTVSSTTQLLLPRLGSLRPANSGFECVIRWLGGTDN